MKELLNSLKDKTVGKLVYELSEGHLGGYTKRHANPRTWCAPIWDVAIDEFDVKSVLDVGCGLGFAAKYFQDRGCEVRGVDGSPSAIRDSQIPEYVRQHDYTAGSPELGRRFDLVWSAEFVEHVEEQYTANFLKTFSLADKFVMLTYAEPGQGGHHHVNEQPQSYWETKLREIGFEFDSELTARARALLPTEGKEGQHFRDKGLVFRRAQAPQ